MYQTIILFVVIGLDKSLPVCRGTWFTGSASLNMWQPLSEEDSDEIEHSHQTILMFHGKSVSQLYYQLVQSGHEPSGLSGQ